MDRAEPTSRGLMQHSRVSSVNHLHTPFHGRRGSTPRAFRVMARVPMPQNAGSFWVLQRVTAATGVGRGVFQVYMRTSIEGVSGGDTHIVQLVTGT